MTRITFLKGDATKPDATGPRMIVHICNDIGGWGKGFVLALSKRWKAPEIEYRRWYVDRTENDFGLGSVQFVLVEPNFWVANMIGQHGIERGQTGEAPIRYDAVQSCLKKVAQFANEHNCSVHMPRIGCGLAGGRWEEIEKLIENTCLASHIPVFVYDFD